MGPLKLDFDKAHSPSSNRAESLERKGIDALQSFLKETNWFLT